MDKNVFEIETKKVVDIVKMYGAEKVIVFGSSVRDIESANDIDIAVSGVNPETFFEMYGKISQEISDEIDLVPLEYVREHFAKRVLEEGKLLYAREI